MPKTDPTDKRDRSKLSRLSPSAKANKLSEMIGEAMSKAERRKSQEIRRTNRGVAKRSKKFDKSPFLDAIPEKERKIVEELTEDADSSEAEITSLFENAFGKLHDDAAEPNADFRSDEASRNFQRAAYALVLSMIPVAEINYRRSTKQNDAYALNAFIDQARELANDLRQINDADNQVEFIRKRIVSPLFLNAAQVMLTENATLKSTVDTEVKDKHASKLVKRGIDAATKSLGQFLAEMQNSIMAQVLDYLQGNTSAFEVPAAITKQPRRKKKRHE